MTNEMSSIHAIGELGMLSANHLDIIISFILAGAMGMISLRAGQCYLDIATQKGSKCGG